MSDSQNNAAATAKSEYAQARRREYERLAEALASTAEAENELRRYGCMHLPIVSEHIRALNRSMYWHDPRTIRRFYVEMRMWVDEMEETSLPF
jgi:hypothetical protein